MRYFILWVPDWCVCNGNSTACIPMTRSMHFLIRLKTLSIKWGFVAHWSLLFTRLKQSVSFIIGANTTVKYRISNACIWYFSIINARAAWLTFDICHTGKGKAAHACGAKITTHRNTKHTHLMYDIYTVVFAPNALAKVLRAYSWQSANDEHALK